MTDLTPGPEMDRAVAEALGRPIPDWYPAAIRINGELVPTYASPLNSNIYHYWSPSTNIAHAIEALEATGEFYSADKAFRYGVTIHTDCDSPWPEGANAFAEADTLPEAACRAILARAEAKERGDE